MKKWKFLVVAMVLGLTGWSQSPTFNADVEKTEQRIREWAGKNGYELMISFKNAKAGAIVVEPAKDYTIFYVYDMLPRTSTNFRASLLNPDSTLRKKYSAKTYKQIVGSIQSAQTQMLQFSTKKTMDMGLKQAPVKLDASPNANIYVYHRPKR